MPCRARSERQIPAIISHPEYQVYLHERIARYEQMSNITYNFLKEVPGFRVTLLEKDKAECERVYRTLAEKIGEYLDS